MTMKNGQCTSCSGHQIRCNRNRKFPALNTITLGVINSGARYASLDTYVCVTCGYVASYVTSPEDLDYIKENWAPVAVSHEYEERSPQNGNGKIAVRD